MLVDPRTGCGCAADVPPASLYSCVRSAFVQNVSRVMVFGDRGDGQWLWIGISSLMRYSRSAAGDAQPARPPARQLRMNDPPVAEDLHARPGPGRRPWPAPLAGRCAVPASGCRRLGCRSAKLSGAASSLAFRFDPPEAGRRKIRSARSPDHMATQSSRDAAIVSRGDAVTDRQHHAMTRSPGGRAMG